MTVDRPEMPHRLAVKAFVDRTPLPGALVTIHFPTTKSPVAVVVGPTDELGELVINGDDLQTKFDQSVATGLMNYGRWTGEVFAQVANLADLERMRLGHAIWGVVDGLFPDDFADQLEHAEGSLERHAGEQVRVVVGSDPPNDRVHGGQQPV